MVSPQDIELLANILQRAPVSQIEAMWLNDVLDQLRAMVMPAVPAGNQSAEAATGQVGDEDPETAR